MNWIKKLPFICFFAVIGCTQPKQIKNITFTDYVRSLDKISLPFAHSCSGPNFSETSISFDTVNFEKYKDPNCARPLGVLFNDKTNIIIVDLSYADFCIDPFLVSYNNKGHKIDALNLYENTFADTASSSMPYFVVNKDKTIVVIDTVKNWKLDKSQKDVPNSDSITIYSTAYRISEKGKFIKGIRKKL